VLCLCNANEMFGCEMSADDVMKEVLRDKIYYKTSGGGMTLSGGEPSMQSEFALELIQKAKDAGIRTSIETCGYGDRSFYEAAASMGSAFLYDIKCMLREKHKLLTGVDNERIIANLLYLFESGADVTIRLPMIPGVNDSRSDIEELCSFLRSNEGKYRYAEIMPYHSFGVAKAERVGTVGTFREADASDEDIKRWCNDFAHFGITVKVSR